MSCAARGSIRGVSWPRHTPTAAPGAQPIFAANDNGDIDYRAVAAAAARLWRTHGHLASVVAANRAQAAFWHGRMATCRWWHSVARMIDRAFAAGLCLRADTGHSPSALAPPTSKPA
jgi:hypothetical protein